MQYLVNVIDYRSESGTVQEAVAIDAFNEKLVTGGHWVFAAGLADTAPSPPTRSASTPRVRRHIRVRTFHRRRSPLHATSRRLRVSYLDTSRIHRVPRQFLCVR